MATTVRQAVGFYLYRGALIVFGLAMTMAVFTGGLGVYAATSVALKAAASAAGVAVVATVFAGQKRGEV